MGSWFSSFGSPTLPTPVKSCDLQNKDETAMTQFRNDYRNLGVAVLEMHDEFHRITTQYRSICDEWFKSNNFTEKKKFIAESKDELFKELGRRPNIGYILTEHKKEYLKFKDSSSNDMFPNQHIHTAFKQLFPQWNDIAMVCMDVILSELVESSEDSKQNSDETEEKIPQGFEPMTETQDRENIRKFGEIHSSLSLIHYFNQKCEKKDEEGLTEEDDRLSNRTEEVPLGNHVDTGVMTFITCSDQFGLQILDRKTNKYYYPEKVFDPTRHIFVIAGRKMQLFSWKKAIEPTWHAVRIPVDKERNSLLYFMEIQKDN